MLIVYFFLQIIPKCYVSLVTNLAGRWHGPDSPHVAQFSAENTDKVSKFTNTCHTVLVNDVSGMRG
jgi:hypothetical protein